MMMPTDRSTGDPPMKRTNRPPTHIPEPRIVTLPPKGYQPSKADLEEEFDMPGMSDQQLRETFFRPFNFVREDK